MPTDTYTGDTSEAQDLTPPFQGDTSEAVALPPRQSMAPRDWARGGGGDTLNVAKAQKIINAFTADPSWLADPRTAHAANSVFSAASKVVGMNIQLERLNSKADAARAQSSTGNMVGKSLLKLAEGGGNGAKWASQWYAQGEDGKPLYENPQNWATILNGYEAHSVASKSFAPSPGEKEDAYLQRLIDQGASPEMIQIQRDRIAAHSQTPEAKADLAFKSSVAKMDETQRRKKAAELTKHIDDAEAKATFHLKSGDETQAEAFKEMAGSYRRKLGVLEGSKTGTAAPPASEAPPASTEKIRVFNPDGTKGFIPTSQKDAALQQGYKLIP